MSSKGKNLCDKGWKLRSYEILEASEKITGYPRGEMENKNRRG